MEIRGFNKEIVGVITTADVVEGRLGLLTTHTFSHDFGSREDLAGFKVPATAEEAKRARYIITWAVDNREYPAFLPIPSVEWAERGGWSKAQTHPFSATIYLTNPGNKEGLTISSGTPALAFGKGVYTVPSGCYIDHNDIIKVGSAVVVANTADDSTDAGKLKYAETYDADTCIGKVREYDSTTGRLTIQIG